MKIAMVAAGWENIPLQALSAVLKQNGHQVELVYDQALFDDKNYLKIDWLAKLFDQRELVVQKLVEMKPDLVCFHVMTVQYRHMYEIAKEFKKYSAVPIIFGGIHPHSAPESVLLPNDPVVDIVCQSEGEYALLELVESMATGKIDYTIKNLLFRLEDGTIIKNCTRPLIENLDLLPPVDKDLFKNDYPLHYTYLSCPSRGCPYSCTFCSLSFLAAEASRLKGKRVRERSPRSLIDELKVHVKKYKSQYVDFRQPVMASKESWILEFFKMYKEEIGLPFRCFMHPHLITEAGARAMRDAGCFAIQIGVECWNEEIRFKVFNRYDTNAKIKEASRILESIGQYYAFDYILGAPRLPVKKEDGTFRHPTKDEILASYTEELMGFAEFIVPLKYMYRVAPFMMQYMPGTGLMEHGLRSGELDPAEVERLKSGQHDNYMSGGSIGTDPQRLRLLNGYRCMYRLMSFLPPWGKWLLIKLKAYKIFWMAPFKVMISMLDLMIAVRDKDARAYAKNYVWWIMKRFDPNYHLFWFRKKKVFQALGETFQLPKDGIINPERYLEHLKKLNTSRPVHQEVSQSL